MASRDTVQLELQIQGGLLGGDMMLDLVLLFIIIGCSLSTCQGTYPDIQHVMMSALRVAKNDMMHNLALNEMLFKSGIDSDKHKFDHKRMLNMFHFMKKSRNMDANIAEMLLRATQELSRMLRKSVADLRSHHGIVAKWLAMTSPYCKPRLPVCNYQSPFRTIDGTCNNRKYTTWGMADRLQRRVLPPVYEDGISIPRQYTDTGDELPSPRLISNILHQSRLPDVRERSDTVMLMQWGQLLDHDLLDTPVMQGHNGAGITCCGMTRYKQRPSCFPIPVPPGDKFFKTGCMNMVRSAPTSTDDCVFAERNQLNQATSYIDASYLYGADDETAKQLRTFERGELKMTGNGMFSQHTNQHNCVKKQPRDYCMKSGDERLHVVPGLASTQILMLREHNRIAAILGRLNVKWNDERIYQETRKIIIAINQHITYTEYLPKVLGPNIMRKYGLHSKRRGFHTVYDPSKDATIMNVFGAAAFRFGHSQITNNVGMISYNNTYKSTRIENTFNKPEMLFTDNHHGPDNVNRWLCQDKGGKSDRLLPSGVRDKLFLDEDGKSFDLAALNIQRGRDHGIAGYNAWREWCQLPVGFQFSTGPGGLVDMDKEVAEILNKLYRNPADMDLFAAGLSERHVDGGRLGPTFACIVARQFHNLKHGDRFWYENNFRQTGFTEGQLNEIKKVRLSHVMCRNTDTVDMPRDVFSIKSQRNPSRRCSLYPDIDFRYWMTSSPSRQIKMLYPPLVPIIHLLPVKG